MTEEELMNLALSGDDQAFNELVQPYIIKLKKTAYLLLHDYNLAEDAVQEALIQTYKNLPRFNPDKAKFYTWINKITIHMVGKIKRRQRFKLTKLTESTIDNATLPDSQAILNEEHELLYQAILRLSFKHQTVITLFYYQELSVEEIAQTLNIHTGTVKSRLHQARKKLRAMYSGRSDY